MCLTVSFEFAFNFRTINDPSSTSQPQLEGVEWPKKLKSITEIKAFRHILSDLILPPWKCGGIMISVITI